MKTIFFDFDGTIVDTKTLYYDVIGDSIKFLGYDKKEINKAIDFGENLKKTLRKLGFSWFVTWFLKKKIMGKVKKRVNEIKKCGDVGAIRSLKGKKILVTNSLKGFAIPVLRHLKIKKYFSEIYGAEDFGDKGDFLKEYIKKNKLEGGDCFYIGDRVRDVEVAKEAGCKSVIVLGKCAWDSKKDLVKAGADFLVGDLRDVKEIVG